MIRLDNADLIYKNEKGKFRAVLAEIVERHGKGQPILVGTISVEKSEVLSHMLKQKGIEHVVLNAKYHMREAEIVAQAGRKAAVTISTNMAGRASTGRSKTTSCASSAPSASPASWSASAWRRTCPSSTAWSTAPSRTRSARSKGTTSTSARTSSITTTS